MNNDELIFDNGFTKQRKYLPSFFDADGPGMMTRALTFDERSLLTLDRKGASGDKFPCKKDLLTRASTMVSKNTFEVKEDTTIAKILFRRHFSEIGKNLSAILPSYVDAQFFPPTPPPESLKEVAHYVIVVDPYGVGARLAYELTLRRVGVIGILSSGTKDEHHRVPKSLMGSFVANLTLNDFGDAELSFNQLASEVMGLQLPIAAVMTGAETGVALAEKLSDLLEVSQNVSKHSLARRNKFHMGETIRRAGVRAVKQVKATTWGEIAAFLKDWDPTPFEVIAKPIDSGGSEDAALCRSLTELQDAFGHIMGKVNGLGLLNEAVLVQEYLSGQEYVVDMVSRDGEHKAVALWQCDKRAVNGASFVFFGQRLLSLSAEGEDNGGVCNELIAYQKNVLDSLGVRNGPTHGKIMWNDDGPVLIEVGCHCQGREGQWVDITNESMGYNQVSVAIDACLLPEGFQDIPSMPLQMTKHAAIKYLVIQGEKGTLKQINEPFVQEIRNMPSYCSHQWYVKVGEPIAPTIDCFTFGGCVQLRHEDADVLQRDYARLEEIEASLLFTVEVTTDHKSQQRHVGIVDPFSTGASLAAYIYSLGYRVIAIYSANMEQLSTMKNLIPQNLVLEFDRIITFDEGVKGIVSVLQGSQYNVLAVMAGAETGVELADNLSSQLGLRTNGTEFSLARRNKFHMGETVRRAGVRAVKQVKATTWGEIAAFLKDWDPTPFEVIAKPIDSAGSEDVLLCRSLTELQDAFGHIMGKVNGLGLLNEAVLVQEYLSGQEYVVDMVSRDGEHKAVALWQCDKRAVNGASFVLYGYIPILASDPICQELIEYGKKVLDALGILNGPSHGEVKWEREEPVLVEVGARCHGGEGTWVDVANAVYGYNQVNATASVYLPGLSFESIPSEPISRQGHGRLLCLICKVCGLLTEICADYIEELRNMRSFIRMEIFLKPGQVVKKTIDCFTLAGVVMLSHHIEAQVVDDYNRLREMEDSGLFVCQGE